MSPQRIVRYAVVHRWRTLLALLAVVGLALGVGYAVTVASDVRELQRGQLENRRQVYIDACHERNARWHKALESYRHLPRQPGQKRPPNYERVLQDFTDATVGPVRPCRYDAVRRIKPARD